MLPRRWAGWPLLRHCAPYFAVIRRMHAAPDTGAAPGPRADRLLRRRPEACLFRAHIARIREPGSSRPDWTDPRTARSLFIGGETCAILPTPPQLGSLREVATPSSRRRCVAGVRSAGSGHHFPSRHAPHPRHDLGGSSDVFGSAGVARTRATFKRSSCRRKSGDSCTLSKRTASLANLAEASENA
jgi:hypothetical protein